MTRFMRRSMFSFLHKAFNVLVIFAFVLQPFGATGFNVRAFAADETVVAEIPAEPTVVSEEEKKVEKAEPVAEEKTAEPEKKEVAPVEPVAAVADGEDTEEEVTEPVMETPLVEEEVAPVTPVLTETEELTPVIEEPAAPEMTESEETLVEADTDTKTPVEQPTEGSIALEAAAAATSVVAEEAPVEPKEVWSTKDGVSTTNDPVELGKLYAAPQNDQVTVTFTKLPEHPGTLSIEEITLTDEQKISLQALSDKAYDITSDMADGTFAYELSLPKAKDAKDVQVKFAEDMDSLAEAETVPSDDVETNKTSVNATLDHFTIFVVTNDATADCPGNVYAAGVCYANLQDAVNASEDGDIIDIRSDITVSNRVEIDKEITIDGHGNTISPSFVKTDNSNNASLAIFSDNTTVKDLVINGTNGTSLHGINIYQAEDVLLDNVTVSNNDSSGITVNGSIVVVNNVTTSGNGWGGINVDRGSGVTTEAKLTVNGTSSHNEAAHIWIDDITKSDVSVVDASDQYKYTDTGNTRVYTLKPEDTAPTVPVLTWPVDGVAIQDNTPLMQWGDSTDAGGSGVAGYEYRVYYNCSNTSAIPSSCSGLYKHSSLIVSSELQAGTSSDRVYYWQVRAKDGAENFSDWSDLEKFTIDTIVPTKPTITKPSDGAYFTTPLIRNEWTPVADNSGIKEYRVEYIYDDGHTFSGGPYRTTSSTWRNHTPGVGEQGGVTIRAQAIDNAGNEGAWSDAVHYYYDATAPAVPTGIYFKDTVNNKTVACGGMTSARNFDVYWNANTEFDFDHYEYISFNADGSTGPIRTFTQPYFDASWWTVPTEGVYGVQIRAVDHAGNKSAWFGGAQGRNNSCAYTADWAKPTTPSITGFLNPNLSCGATTNIKTVTVEWSDATDSRGVVGYDYSIDYPLGTGRGQWTTSFPVSQYRGTLNEGIHYIKVRSKDATGNVSDWSNTCSITYDSVAPTAPTPISPVDGVFVKPLAFSQTWTSETGAVQYRYQSCNVDPGDAGGTCSSEKFTQLFTGTTKNVGAGQPNSHFWWRVQAKDAVGNWSAYGKAFELTIDNTIPTVDLVFSGTGPSITGFNVVFSENVNRSEAEDPANYFLNNWPGAGGTGDLAGDAIVSYDPATHTATVQFTNSGWYVSPEQEWGVQNVRDLAGNLQAVNPYTETSTPMVAPVTTDSGTDGDWHKSDVTVTLSCDDGTGSGCKTTYYTTDGSTPTLSSAQGSSVVVGNEEETTIKYFSVDNAGNAEVVKTAAYTVKIDKTNPASIITTFDLADEGSVTTPAWNGRVDGTASDDRSGVSGVKLEIARTLFGSETTEYWNGSTWQDMPVMFDAVWSETWSYQLPGTVEEGTYHVSSHAVDNAGNEEATYAITINYDKTIPEVVLTIDPTDPNGDNGWYDSGAQITLTATDNFHIDRIEYQLNGTGGAWTLYTVPVVLQDGVWQFYYRGIDTAANVSGIGLKNVKIDMDSPSNVQDLDATYKQSPDRVQLTWEADDSDIDQVYIYRGKSKDFTVNTSSRIAKNNRSDEKYSDYDVEPGEKYYYKFVTVDNAGNKSGAKALSVELPLTGTAAIVTDEGTEALPEGTVLGVETSTEEDGDTQAFDEDTDNGNIGRVLGEETEASSDDSDGMSFWWWLLIVIVVGGAGYYIYGFYQRNRKGTF